jgi:hypothetical protein
MKWVDEFFEDEECNLYQISKIESLMKTSSAAYLYEDVDITELTYEEANQVIKELRENDNPIDPREQFNRFFK